MKELNSKPIPESVIFKLEKDLTYFFGIYGVWMAYVTLNLDVDWWVFFKTIGFYISFFIFLLLEVFSMRKKSKFTNRITSKDF